MTDMIEFQVIVQVERVDGKTGWQETAVPKHCPVVFDTLKEAETYCDDLVEDLR